MDEDFGSNYITISDEDGTEYELEILSEFDHKGNHYLAVIPAGSEEEDEASLEVSLLKSVEEDGEPILCAIEDEAELEEVYGIMMDQLYEEDEDEV